MKFFATFLLLAVIGHVKAEKCPDHLAEVMKECLVKTKTSEVVVMELLALQPSSSEEAKCFRLCIMTDCGYLDSSSGAIAETSFAVQTGILLGGGDPEKMKNVQEASYKCLETIKHQDNLCQYSEDIFNCVITTSKPFGVVVPNIIV